MSDMAHLHPHNTGIAVGGIFAIVHFLWALLVLFGIAQIALNWVFRLHFIEPTLRVAPFSLTLAFGLIVLACIVGYVVGWLFATVWNVLQK